MKNYQKTDLVVKNKQYSKNFSNLLVKNNERKNQSIQFTWDLIYLFVYCLFVYNLQPMIFVWF